MLLRDALTSAVNRLSASRVPSPRMNAELLLMFTLNCDRAYLYAHPERQFGNGEQSRYDQALDQRAQSVGIVRLVGAIREEFNLKVGKSCCH